MTTRHTVWDPAIRLFHWALVAAFTANALFTDGAHRTHRWVGYAVIGLLMFRVIWGLVGTRHARFADFPPSVTGALGQLSDMATGRRSVHVGHSPLGALMIYNLLAALTGIVVTGTMMTTLTWFGVEWVQTAHGLLVTWAEISVVASRIGVARCLC